MATIKVGPAFDLDPSTRGDVLEELERGNWRVALEHASVPAPDPSLARRNLVARLLALSMRAKALGEVQESWNQLVSAAAAMPVHTAGTRARLDRARDGAGSGPVLFAVPAGREPWAGLARIGRREERHHRLQWDRIRAAPHPKRAALVEACLDHLVWVEFDPWTWSPVPGGSGHPRLGETGRTDLLARASALYQWVFTFSGTLSKTVWTDLDLYTGVRVRALRTLRRLAIQEAGRGSGQAGVQDGAGPRVGFDAAVRFAALWSSCVEDGSMAENAL